MYIKNSRVLIFATIHKTVVTTYDFLSSSIHYIFLLFYDSTSTSWGPLSSTVTLDKSTLLNKTYSLVMIYIYYSLYCWPIFIWSDSKWDGIKFRVLFFLCELGTVTLLFCMERSGDCLSVVMLSLMHFILRKNNLGMHTKYMNTPVQ